MAAQLAGCLHDRETALAWRVVTEHVERILTGVEAGGAGLHLAFVLVGTAKFELVAAASQVLVEALVGGNDFFSSLGLFLACHDAFLWSANALGLGLVRAFGCRRCVGMRKRAEKEPGRSRAKDGGKMLTYRGVIWPVLISGFAGAPIFDRRRWAASASYLLAHAIQQ